MDILYEIKEKIELNNKETFSMIKEYMLVYMKSLIFDLYGTKKRKEIRKSIIEYCETIKLENMYLGIIVDNINYIDPSKTEEFMDRIDILNEETFYYYECILKAYEDSIFQQEDEQVRLPHKNFKTLTEDSNYYTELLDIFKLPKNKEINKSSNKINQILIKNKKSV